MSTLSHQRRAIQRTINWNLYREQRAHLADLFSVIAYSGQDKRPLVLGIKYDLIGANTGLSPADVKHFLRAYTYGPKYLRQLKAGARRFDLAGLVVGSVSDDEADHAALCLKTHYEMKRCGRVGLTAVAKAVVAEEPVYEYRFARRGGVMDRAQAMAAAQSAVRLRKAAEGLHLPPSIQNQRNLRAMNACDEAADLIERIRAVPQAVQVPADQVARTLALSYGRDPDAMTEWTEMCDAHNRPVSIWKVYQEQAEALRASYSITRPEHS